MVKKDPDRIIQNRRILTCLNKWFMILNLMLLKLIECKKREDTVTRQESVQITNATLANSTIENEVEIIKLKSKLQV